MTLLQIHENRGSARVAAPNEEPSVPTMNLSSDLKEVRATRDLAQALKLTMELIQDSSFPTARAWVAGGGHAAAFFPVYTPQEIAHALGLLPVSLRGGGEDLEITHADAALGSFLCSISKSTLELAITGKLDPFGAFVFPYICDVSRNLEGIFSRLRPNAVTHMLHLPQNFTSASSVPFLVAEYGRLVEKLERLAGQRLSKDALADSLQVYNRRRALLADLAALRRSEPWKLAATELNLLERLGDLVPPEVQMPVLERALREVKERQRPKRDAVRVILVGPFCEQPTHDLLSLIEEAGCYVVGDELSMLHRWMGDVPVSGDPLENLARAYIRSPVDIGVRATPMPKGVSIVARAKEAEAQGVLFLTAKFCEPALEDVVLYRKGLDDHKIPYLHLEFEEKSTSYEQSRLQIETFVESVLFD